MSNSGQPSSTATLFLDATHQAKITARLLRDLGVSVEVHRRHFVPAESDPVWIAACAARGWAIISGDKGIEYDGVNRSAVISAKAKVFILADTTSRTIEWAASLVMARHKILRIASENDGPFYCDIDKAKDDHVGKPRFLVGGGPLSKQTSMSDSQIGTPDESSTSIRVEPEIPETGKLFEDD